MINGVVRSRSIKLFKGFSLKLDTIQKLEKYVDANAVAGKMEDIFLSEVAENAILEYLKKRGIS
jgi:hypothetical protein